MNLSPTAISPEMSIVSPVLSPEEWMLVRLRDELYEGRWEEMRLDLVNRLNGKPYIFRLAHRIQDDLARIERLISIEDTQGVNLGKYLPDHPA